MNKCLVEKLNGTVNSTVFQKVGALRVNVKDVEGAASSIRVAYNEGDIEAHIIGDGGFIDGGSIKKTQTSKSSGGAYEMLLREVTAGNFTIEYDNKYELRFIGCYQDGKRFEVDLSHLAYSTGIKYIEFVNTVVYGDIASLGNLLSLKNVLLSYCVGRKVYGDTSVFKNDFSEIEYIDLDFSSNNITGSLTDFTGLTTLKKLHLYDTSVRGMLSDVGNLVNLNSLDLNKKIEGSIEDFVAAQRSNGRLECDKIQSLFLYSCPLITFGGSPIRDKIGTSNSTSKISWTSNTITVDDITINA